MTDIGYEKFVNLKITKDTTSINDLNHDLSTYLSELFEGIPDERDKKMILHNISTYYDSLNTLLVKFTLKHSCSSN